MSARLCSRSPPILSLCLNDSNFGPQSLCRSFDFTVTFEASILLILPSTIFICTAAPYLWIARPWRNFNLAHIKNSRSITIVLSFFLLICTALLSFVSWLTSSPNIPSVTIKLIAAALGLKLVSSILFVVVGFSAITSKMLAFMLALYQFISLILQTALLRTFILDGRSTSKFFLASYASMFGTTALVVIGLSMPERKVRNRLSEGDGLFNHLFVFWALPLMWKGRKADASIDYELHPEMESTELYRRFKLAWSREMNQHPAHPLLVRALFRAFSPTFLSTVPPAMIRALAQVVQPLLVNAAIKFVSSYALGSTPQPSQWGWALAGTFALVFLALSGATSLYFYSIAKTGGYIRGALIEAMFRKALVLRADSVTDATGGDPLNLMSSDVERITTHLDMCHQIWSGFIIIILGLYILYSQLGLGPFVAALPIIFLVLISTPLLSRKIGPLEEDITSLCDKRVRLVTSILRQVKGVKLAALESEVEDRVKAARTAELGARRRFWDRFAIVVSLTNTTLNLLSLFTLGTYSIIFFLGHGPPLSTARLFTAYSTLTIISASLFAIGQGLPAVTQAYVSVQRIEKYLSTPDSEHHDDRHTGHPDTKESDTNDLSRTVEPIFPPGLEKPRSVILHLKSSTSSLSVPARGERGESLVFDSARVAWGDKVIMNGLDATICLQQLTMVIGRVASGKSTLLAALLGETNILAGRVFFPLAFRGAIAYCSQSPWIQGSLSVRQNVLFAASAMEQTWYERVITACALDIDLALMPEGDSTLARGLSGGQKARVALARAVYSKFEVVVLDDVFAALDPETSSAVFNALFGADGLLRGKTVVLATNQFAQLKHSDWIISLHNSEESHQGTYAEFLASNNTTGRLIREHIYHPSSEESKPILTVEGTTESSQDMEREEEPETDEIAALESNSKFTPGQTYLHYMRSVGRNRMTLYAILLLLAIGIQVATPVFLQVWSTFNDIHSTRLARNKTGIFLGGYALFEVLYSISITALFYFVIMVVTLRASANLHHGLFSALMKTTIEFFSTTHPGQIISRFSQDIFILDDLFPISFYDFGYQLMRLLGSAILMIVSVPYLAVVVVLVMGVAYFVQKFYLATAKRLRRMDLSSKAPLYTLFQETIDFNGLLTIRAASAEHRLTQSNTLLLAQSQRPFYLTTIASVWFASTIGVMTATVNTAIVILAVATRHSTNAGLLAVGLTQAVSLQDTITLMLTSWTQLEISAVALERNLEYSNLPPEQDPLSTLAAMPDGLWPSRGDVTFTDVFARYTIDAAPVLRGISFHASAGSKLGIVGRMGGGKSTLLLALLRALHTEGEILIDNVNILDVPRPLLRKSITVIPQDPFVLAGTVRQNVDIGGQKSDAEIWVALEVVELKPTVTALEGGLDHELTLSGRTLSQGQLQLLAMARALLSGSKLAIFDEPTANIDPETDIIIQNVIRSSFRDCTVFAIVHRLDNIKDFDQVVVLDAGKIVESGKPSELALKEDSIYRQLSIAHRS
ncbi:P-loop containing nucleoside triphosphate hydrolase protein [Mycena alexandri]|uniref:P-loop containing nucleoside triphosphate hydrolase protein n=1 Tax=Mycena alexandri TaxID=1745969 RepID=A0AAD6TK41_9AGAR|nr:P-loop containing nucleoside triphosphate hydrolase protein [Mycena alexandri]